VRELAESCVRYVKAALGFELDYERDTLPVLDGYLVGAREAVRARPETLPLVAAAVGAYLGEVVRRCHPCWWRADRPDPIEWQIEFRDVYLSFRPVELAQASLLLRAARPSAEPALGERPDDDGGPAGVSAGPRASDPPPATDDEGEPGAESDDPLGDPAAAPLDLGAELGAEEPAEPGIVVDELDRAAVRARLDRLPPVTEEEYWAPSTRLEVIDIALDAIQAQYLADPARRREHGPADYDDTAGE
jgi:hypothetical protein